MLVSLSGVAKLFGSRVIFKGVTLEVTCGTVTLLVGPNGAGKSTLLRIMAGLGQSSAGSVDWDVPEAKVGYLGHATFVYAGLTALENLAFWRDVYGLHRDLDREGRERALLDILHRVELAPFAHERAGVFSRGMAQRLNLARVLLLQPQLLLLDEPSTGLDLRSAALLRREIMAAREAGAGVVWISHDVHGDAVLADRVVALEHGRVAYDGVPSGYQVGMPPGNQAGVPSACPVDSGASAPAQDAPTAFTHAGENSC